MAWFYMVSHPIMTPYALGRPPRPANQEILEAQDNHTEDVTTICWHVWEMGKSCIEGIIFEDGRPKLVLMANMVSELQNVM